MANGGYFLIHRRFFNHWLWDERRRYSRAEAWLDLIQQASFADGQRFVSGSVVPLQRGQLFISTRFLAARWQWNIKSVHQFLKLLEGERMIVQKVNAKGNTLTLVNFDSYQTNGNAEETLRGTKQSNGNKRKETLSNLPGLFEEIWRRYPAKDGKRAALKSFLSTVKDERGYQRVSAALDNYTRHLEQETWKKPKNGSTWFNNWQDWEEVEQAPGGSVTTWQDEQQRQVNDELLQD